MRNRYWDWPMIIGGTIVALVVAFIVALIGTLIYLSATGGFNYTDTENINGQRCVVVRERITHNIVQVDCGKVRP